MAHGAGSDEGPALDRREQVVAQIPAGYRGELHLAGLFLEATFFMGLAVWQLHGVRWWELLIVPFSLMFANAVEWVLHKGPLHHPVTPRILYKRHTLMHHAAFSYDDMSVHDWKELRIVLFPLFALPLLMLLVVPVAGALYLLGQHNAAWLFVFAATFYYLLYEVLHLSYHLPKDHPVSRLSVVKWLMRHHRTHHEPRLMTRGNFNVSIPFFDWVMGSIIKDGRDGR